jgi:hypothetical protein
MPAKVTVTSTFGLTAPENAILTRSETTSEVKAVKQDGTVDGKVVTVLATTEKFFTKTVRLSGKGAVNFALIVAGAIVAGTVKLMMLKQTEENNGFPGFDAEGLTYGNL